MRLHDQLRRRHVDRHPGAVDRSPPTIRPKSTVRAADLDGQLLGLRERRHLGQPHHAADAQHHRHRREPCRRQPLYHHRQRRGRYRLHDQLRGWQLTVTPAPLTITANNQTKVYGAALPTLTASYSGFVNGDTSASLTTQPTLTTTATAASHVAGSPYAITASGAVDADYTISYVAGTLTVTPAALDDHGRQPDQGLWRRRCRHSRRRTRASSTATPRPA